MTPTQRPRFKSVFVVELYLDSGLRAYATDDLVIRSPVIIDEGTLEGYNVGGYSGITTSSGDQGYDVT